MAKIGCTCGHTISDNTDFISYKARFIADQDVEDFLYPDQEVSSLRDVQLKAIRFFGEIFQCPKCQRLILFRPGQNKGVSFIPEDKQSSEDLLISYLGADWPGTIAANFSNGKGQIYWHTNLESGFLQDLSLPDLKDLYQTKFAELSKMQILRSSFLRIHDRIEHEFKRAMSS